FEIIEAAKQIWDTLPLTAKIADTGDELPPPKWSNGWVYKFKRRHNISSRKFHGEAASVPLKAHEEMKTVRLIAKEYELRDVYNMNESGLFWRRGPSRGLSTKGLPGPKEDKSRVTITVCCNADGSDKFHLFYTGKANTPQSFTATDISTNKWTWTNNPSAWMTGQVMIQWLQKFYNHIGKERNVLLLMDNFSGHIAGIKQCPPPANIRIEYLPAKSTSIYQPLDQGIIYNAKVHYLKRLLAEQKSSYRATRDAEEAGLDPIEKKPKVSIKDAIWWFYDVWTNQVQADTIKNCFKKSTLFDENYPIEEFVPPEIPEDVAKAYAEVVELGNITDAMDIQSFISPEGENDAPVSSVPTISEIVKMYSPVTDEDESSEDTEGCAEVRKLTWKTGIKAADELVHLSNFISDDTSELKRQCRQFAATLARIMRQSTIQTTLPQFALVTGNSSSDSTSRESLRSKQVEFVARNTRDIVAQLNNTAEQCSRQADGASAADDVVEIDLTNDDGLGDESIQTSSRMSLTYVCEGSGSEPNVQTDSSESDQSCMVYSSDSSDPDI
ncbi:hypothetical protein OY671_007479, partial [Metschnikowia pulcherrima]